MNTGVELQHVAGGLKHWTIRSFPPNYSSAGLVSGLGAGQYFDIGISMGSEIGGLPEPEAEA